MLKKLIKKVLGCNQTPKELWKAKFNEQLKAIHKGIEERGF